MVEVRKSEVLRYMGVRRGANADVSWAIDAVREADSFRFITSIRELSVEENEVNVGGAVFSSAALARHVCGCKRAALFCATLGAETDRLIMRASLTDVSKAVVLDAAATALIEAHCDRETSALPFHRARFSPGYGDFSIEYQREILNALDAPRRIGLTLLDSLMMAPAKSVTAVIGLGDKPSPAPSCAECDKPDCAFRKRDKEV